MTDSKKESRGNKSELDYGLNDELRIQILDALDSNISTQVNKLFLDLHPADQASFVVGISRELRERLISTIGTKSDSQFLTYLEGDIKHDVLDLLGAKASAKAIDKLEVDVAVEVIEDLKSDGIDEILSHVSDERRAEIEETLSYPEESIGRLMHQNFVAIKQDWTVAEATKYLQTQKNLPDDFQYIVIVDDNFSPISEVLVSKILINKKDTLISSIMSKEGGLRKIHTNLDQEEVSKLFSRYSLSYTPVVDDDDKLVGLIYAGDVIDILEEEAEEDILLLGGVNYSNLYSAPFTIAKSRIPWLFTSLLTTAMATIIIAIFSDQIQKIIALAVLLPVVASLSGNAGTQALTVLVRSIATDEVDNVGAIKIMIKEVLVGSFNGLILAIIAAIVCYVWQGDLYLSSVLAVSIFLTIVFAGFFGATIPLLLDKMRFDPAISSGVFLIAITDASSFLIFLGLASLFLK